MKVAVIMGSMSDFPKVEVCINTLKRFDVEVDVRCYSAHRTPKELESYVLDASKNGVEVFIAAAGMAAALPGVIASMTVLPVIGLPISSSVLDGVDALYSIVQMPPGIPVATVAINGAKNAAYLAIEILAVKYTSIKEKLINDREEMKKAVLEANVKLINESK